MMKKKLGLYEPIFYILLATSVVLVVPSFFIDINVFYIECGVLLLSLGIVIYKMWRIKQEIQSFLQVMGETVSVAQKDSLLQFPIPVVVISDLGEILWYNDLAQSEVLGGKGLYGVSIGQYIKQFDLETVYALGGKGLDIECSGKLYTIYAVKTTKNDQTLCVLYFVDNTYYKRIDDLYKKTRPSVMLITIDNYDELMKSDRESARIQVSGQIETILESFMQKNNGLMRKMDRDRYVAIIEEQHMRTLIEERFPLLDSVRALNVPGHVPVTFSIGIGRGADTLKECDQMARQALDMALGRGGDQAAVRTGAGFEFYGGVSRAIEKRTKVKTRTVATALKELIEQSDRVLIMGHRFADLDCMGAAIGLAGGVELLGKKPLIVVNAVKNLCGPLMERMSESYTELFIEPEHSLSLITPKTLLIIVDTHMTTILESLAVYKQAQNIVVIDHHRKMVGHIDNAVIFYHEPFASSTSEMVAELLPYLDNRETVGRLHAEAMLSGIMLDTRNFVIKTGVRTFEAAGYLRQLGADTVEVRRLFSSTMDDYQRKSRIVATAEVYRGCAIATAEGSADELRVVAPQAADELLGINNVDASFVLYDYGGSVSISGRSLGSVNVQIILEKLGGGGHHTMAGAQIGGATPEAARQKLLEAIDEFFDLKKGT